MLYKESVRKINCSRRYLLVMITSERAKRLLEDSDMTVIAPIILSDGELNLGKKSPFITDVEQLGGVAAEDEVRSFIVTYGSKAWKGHPLGFGNSALGLGLHHNVPDNTLPIFWQDNPWRPVFSRRPKKGGPVSYDPRPFI